MLVAVAMLIAVSGGGPLTALAVVVTSARAVRPRLHRVRPWHSNGVIHTMRVVKRSTAQARSTGWAYNAGHNPKQEAYRSSGVTVTGLGILNLGEQSIGYAINASGEVAGSSGDLLNYAGAYRAVTWTGTTITDISNGVNSEALGIDDAGDVVGYTEATPGNLQAFLRPQGGSLTNLNSLINLKSFGPQSVVSLGYQYERADHGHR